MLEDLGLTYALAGAAIATFLAGIGSSVGLSIAARAAGGVLSEKPERYGSLMLMVLLPSTQGIYGFVIAIYVMVKLNIIAGEPVAITAIQGLEVLASCLAVAVAGLVSGIQQGKASAGGIIMTAKQPEMSVKAGVLYAAMVEFYAILGFLISFLLLLGIKVGA
ncbi:MAG: V-type ATP synthase subunit K [Sedimentisphaerales bacterium]|nr:V-type ATP synthase subunit K [Sedimentisphaerales bacterium]